MYVVAVVCVAPVCIVVYFNTQCNLYVCRLYYSGYNKQLTYNRKQNKQLLLLCPNTFLKQLSKIYCTVYMCINCILVYGSTTKGDVVKSDCKLVYGSTTKSGVVKRFDCELVYGSTTKDDVVKRSDHNTDMGSAVLLCPLLTIMIIMY